MYCSLLESGVLRAERTDDWPGAPDALSRAWEVRPQQLEVCYELASRLRVRGRYRTVHALLALPDLPHSIRQQVIANRQFSTPYVTAVPRPARSKARKKGARR
ncbi:hypothetical protein ACH47Z_06145 [Streptomyces sp. NPDC020192]|uniref:hypothetical protein n=1 Tax=Streptomyces sp. NPDC020192 TaxID=3365066 RepID=UPI00378C9433